MIMLGDVTYALHRKIDSFRGNKPMNRIAFPIPSTAARHAQLCTVNHYIFPEVQRAYYDGQRHADFFTGLTRDRVGLRYLPMMKTNLLAVGFSIRTSPLNIYRIGWSAAQYPSNMLTIMANTIENMSEKFDVLTNNERVPILSVIRKKLYDYLSLGQDGACVDLGTTYSDTLIKSAKNFLESAGYTVIIAKIDGRTKLFLGNIY